MLFKRRSHGITALLALCALFIGTGKGYAVQTNVELIIDDSGSMAQRLEGKARSQLLKRYSRGSCRICRQPRR
jgi:hypothetical protein